jgi:hypothetical protein
MPANEHYLRHFPYFDRGGTLWRYMSFQKFEKLIESSALWFSSASRFDDTFEGSISDATRKFVTYGPDVTQEMIAKFNEIHLWWRQWTNISCWQYADEENSLMWQAYAKEGVAIRTTFAKLAAELPENATISPVMYKDFSKDLVPDGTHIRYLVKRHYFGPEREVRAILINAPANEVGTEDLTRENTNGGLPVPVHLDRMLDGVVSRPYAAPSEIDRIRSLLTKHGLSVPVFASSLSGEPRWN